jgi:LacI family transcriptional regulator
VQLFDTLGQKENEAQLFQRLARERRIDGVILISSTVSDEQLQVFAEESVPCILVARNCDFLDSVSVNNSQGAQDATDYLLERGHRAIACICCPRHGPTAQERLAGYKNSLLAHGIAFDPALVFDVADDTMQAGIEVFEQLRSGKGAEASAVFVPAGDMVAIGIIKEAKKQGVTVPQKLAVVGYDDLPAAEVIEPTLSTVRQPKLEMGDYAINMIVDKIEGRESTIKHKELQTKFNSRESA